MTSSNARNDLIKSTAPNRLKARQPGTHSRLLIVVAFPVADIRAITSDLLTQGMSSIRKSCSKLGAFQDTASQKCKAFWTKVSDRWSLTACLTLLTTILVGAFGLRYAYVQQKLAYESMKLAEWTAKKDLLELCEQLHVSIFPLDCRIDD